jgi:hypothetical protein
MNVTPRVILHYIICLIIFFLLMAAYQIPCCNPYDTDQDGLADCDDACPNDPENDPDGDGICSDTDICPYDPDNDIDADNICADLDSCPQDPLNDTDADGICGALDNCPDTPNPDQADADQDGMGDACDSENILYCPTGSYIGPRLETYQLETDINGQVRGKMNITINGEACPTYLIEGFSDETTVQLHLVLESSGSQNCCPLLSYLLHSAESCNQLDGQVEDSCGYYASIRLTRLTP